MNNVINILISTTTGISIEFLWEQVGPIVPLIIIIFCFVFGLYLIGKTIHDSMPGRSNIL